MTTALLLVVGYLILPTQRVLATRCADIYPQSAVAAGSVGQGVVSTIKSHVRRVTAQWRDRIMGQRISVGEYLHAAAACDLLAACLRSGLPVAAATKATAAGCHPTLAPAFETCASRFVLGTEDVWESLACVQVLSDVALSAKRVHESGAALASTLQEAADQYRNQALDAAAATAERAGVSIAGPLALCFLPAFVVLGLIPTIAGLASDMFTGWVG